MFIPLNVRRRRGRRPQSPAQIVASVALAVIAAASGILNSTWWHGTGTSNRTTMLVSIGIAVAIAIVAVVYKLRAASEGNSPDEAPSDGTEPREGEPDDAGSRRAVALAIVVAAAAIAFGTAIYGTAHRARRSGPITVTEPPSGAATAPPSASTPPQR